MDLASSRRLIADEWIARVLDTYPEAFSAKLLLDQDPFRNPVGHALREGLSTLVEELLGGMDQARIVPAMDSVVRMRAVQDFTAGAAVSFVFLLRDVASRHLRDDPALLAVIDRRIDDLALVAFDLYMTCRDKLHELRTNELKRSLYLPLRRECNHASH